MTTRASKAGRMLRRSRFSLLYLALVVLAASVLFFDPVDSFPNGVLTEIKKEDRAAVLIKGIADSISFISGLDAALFAGIFVVAGTGRHDDQLWDLTDGAALIVAVVLAATSQYGGYLANAALLDLVQGGAVSRSDPRLLFAIALQYYSFLTSVIVVGFALARRMDRAGW